MDIADILVFQHVVDHFALFKQLPKQQAADGQQYQACDGQKDDQGVPPHLCHYAPQCATSQVTNDWPAGRLSWCIRETHAGFKPATINSMKLERNPIWSG